VCVTRLVVFNTSVRREKEIVVSRSPLVGIMVTRRSLFARRFSRSATRRSTPPLRPSFANTRHPLSLPTRPAPASASPLGRVFSPPPSRADAFTRRRARRCSTSCARRTRTSWRWRR
jgi:hypothetical protein